MTIDQLDKRMIRRAVVLLDQLRGDVTWLGDEPMEPKRKLKHANSASKAASELNGLCCDLAGYYHKQVFVPRQGGAR